MMGGVTRRMLPHLSRVPHLHVNRPLVYRGNMWLQVNQSQGNLADFTASLALCGTVQRRPRFQRLHFQA